MILVQQRAGLEPMDDEGAQQDGRDGVAGHPQGQERNHGAAGAAVVGRFGSRHAFNHTGTELFRRLGGALGFAVGDKGCDVPARTGNGADEGTDNAAFDIGGQAPFHVRHRRQDLRDLFRGNLFICRKILHVGKDF